MERGGGDCICISTQRRWLFQSFSCLCTPSSVRLASFESGFDILMAFGVCAIVSSQRVGCCGVELARTFAAALFRTAPCLAPSVYPLRASFKSSSLLHADTVYFLLHRSLGTHWHTSVKWFIVVLAFYFVVTLQTPDKRQVLFKKHYTVKRFPRWSLYVLYPRRFVHIWRSLLLLLQSSVCFQLRGAGYRFTSECQRLEEMAPHDK